MTSLVHDYRAQIDWNIGGLFVHDQYIIETIKRCSRFEPVPIKYVFGGFPCSLQCGRISNTNPSLEKSIELIRIYNSLGVGCRLTFSSHRITKEDLSDYRANCLLSYMNSSCPKTFPETKNGVIVSSDLLADYVRKNYPNLELISSLVRPSVEIGLGNETSDYYNTLAEKFDIVVLNTAKAHDDEFVSKLNDLSKFEIIANHYCVPNCKFAKEHYDLTLVLQKDSPDGRYSKQAQEALQKLTSKCFAQRRRNPLSTDSLSVQETESLVAKGFRHFKLEGRDNSGDCFMRDMGDYIFNPNMYARVMVNTGANLYCWPSNR